MKIPINIECVLRYEYRDAIILGHLNQHINLISVSISRLWRQQSFESVLQGCDNLELSYHFRRHKIRFGPIGQLHEHSWLQRAGHQHLPIWSREGKESVQGENVVGREERRSDERTQVKTLIFPDCQGIKDVSLRRLGIPSEPILLFFPNNFVLFLSQTEEHVERRDSFLKASFRITQSPYASGLLSALHHSSPSSQSEGLFRSALLLRNDSFPMESIGLA